MSKRHELERSTVGARLPLHTTGETLTCGANNRQLADTMKRYVDLLGQAELVKHFVDAKAERDPEFA